MAAVAVVRMAEVLAQPGHPLDAGYWTGRDPGEAWPAWQARMAAGDLIRRAETHEAHARRLRATAAHLTANPPARGVLARRPDGRYYTPTAPPWTGETSDDHTTRRPAPPARAVPAARADGR